MGNTLKINTNLLDLYVKKSDYIELDTELQRLKAEIEKLKSNIYPQTNYTTQRFYTKEEYERLQAENEKLKIDIGIYKGIIDADKEENERLKSALVIWENATLKQTALKVVKVDKYRQALQEIREMATLFHSVNENKDLDHFKNNILAKINEVIGAKE